MNGLLLPSGWVFFPDLLIDCQLSMTVHVHVCVQQAEQSVQLATVSWCCKSRRGFLLPVEVKTLLPTLRTEHGEACYQPSDEASSFAAPLTSTASTF